MKHILDRTHGYTNEMMVERCETLKKVLTQTKEAKSGRGKASQTIQVPKYRVEPEIIDRLNNSIEHYSKEQGFEFREYQSEIIEKGSKIVNESGFLYLAMEVRTGKTLTSLGIAEKIGSKKVLFITKKKAISSISNDYTALSPSFYLRIVNYESLHLVMNEEKWDTIICDEAHSMGAHPKPSARAKMVADVIKANKPYVILMSGTPTPESYSQMYHQVYGIPKNPFAEFSNFYRFCDKHVSVKEKRLNGLVIKDYSCGKDSILELMRPYTINYTQSEAGFVSEVKEEVLEVEMKQSTYKIIERLKRDLVVEGKEDVILADSPVKLMMKVHQLCSGTIKFESGKSMVIDYTKAEFIKEHFEGSKIGIFYKFKEEYNALLKVFGAENLTNDLQEFDSTDKNIALQIVSGREGISLKMAEYLVYYNIDFSATSYWQSKDRMTTKDRLNNHVYWVFSKGGIEKDVYKAVTKKKDFTINHFKKLDK